MSNSVRPNDKFYTDLDRQLQDLAACDWPAFVRLIGEENVTAAKVCLLKSKGKSYNQIAQRFSKSKGWSQYISDTKCRCDDNTPVTGTS